MKPRPVELAFPAEAIVGEGPCWNTGTLTWVDLFSGVLHLSDRHTGNTSVINVGGVLGAAVPRKDGGFAVLNQDGYALLDGEGNATLRERVVAPADIRMNDGKCDRRGRFWAGSCSFKQDSPVGALFVWTPEGRARRLDSGFVLPNGLGWSPDDTTLYLVDSKEACLYAYDFDLAHGHIEHRRVLCRFDEAEGLADGLAVDEEGAIWIAFFAGSQLIRISSEGKLIERVRVPVSKPTSCAFGDGTDLYVTSARLELTPGLLARQPLAGSVLVVDAGVRGTPVGASR